jgi:hypothetical protein
LQVGAVDLSVVFQFARPLEAGVETLSGLAVGIPLTLEKVASLLRQDCNRAPMTGYADGLDKTLLAQMPDVRRSIVRCAVVVVTKFTRGHYTERSDGGQRSRFRAAQ